MAPRENIAFIGLHGFLKGSFHLYEVRLVAAAPPAPPPVTVVQEA